MRFSLALLAALVFSGCTLSREEWEQQAYWKNKTSQSLVVGMPKAQVIAWAKANELDLVTGNGLALAADPVNPRWPFPCAKTFTMISLHFDQQDELTSFNLGRAGLCL